MTLIYETLHVNDKFARVYQNEDARFVVRYYQQHAKALLVYDASDYYTFDRDDALELASQAYDDEFTHEKNMRNRKHKLLNRRNLLQISKQARISELEYIDMQMLLNAY